MELLAILSTGKGTWGQVIGLINRNDWDNIILIGDSYVKKRISEFNLNKKFDFIQVDFNKGIKQVIDNLTTKLKQKIKGPEVALSIASGSGKEHMIVISSILRVPAGIRFAAITHEGLVLF